MAVAQALLAWFSHHARDLPWRRTRDPYAIWISEIMLQQTQVKTVIPYWRRWMERLPGIAELAGAAQENVLKLWEGLGYYARARNLQKAARLIIEQHGGVFPRKFEEVLELPGVGRYTAGAICSIAFNQPAPILDGNVVRVLTRLFGIRGDPREKTIRNRLWALAQELVSLAETEGPPRARNCSQLNQALMELGALICTPGQPECPACPVRAHCAACRAGNAEHLPNTGKRTSSVARTFAAFVVEKRGRVLLRQRPSGVVNAHFWEFPNEELNGAFSSAKHAATSLKLKLADPQPFCVIKHSITRYRITLKAYRATLKGICPGKLRMGRWAKSSEVELLPLTSAHRKIFQRW
jgi:A/G-specific adenine glycosylase